MIMKDIIAHIPAYISDTTLVIGSTTDGTEQEEHVTCRSPRRVGSTRNFIDRTLHGVDSTRTVINPALHGVDPARYITGSHRYVAGHPPRVIKSTRPVTGHHPRVVGHLTVVMQQVPPCPCCITTGSGFIHEHSPPCRCVHPGVRHMNEAHGLHDANMAGTPPDLPGSNHIFLQEKQINH